MKKKTTYDCPTISVVQVRTAQMIAASETVNTTVSGGPASGAAYSRGRREDWDED